MATDLRALGEDLVAQADALDLADRQVAAQSQQIADLSIELAAALAVKTPTTVYSGYAGPMVQDVYDPPATMNARFATALGVPRLPIERIYSEAKYGLAAASPSVAVAVSYKQVPGLASATPGGTVAALTNELRALAARPSVTYYVSLDHEIDNKVKNGTYTSETYKKALGQFALILRTVNAANIHHEVCYMGWSFRQPTTQPWHPANLWVDGIFDRIALDPYWTSDLKNAKQAFGDGYSWARGKGLPVDVWETGLYTARTQPALTEGVFTQRVAQTLAYWKGRAENVLWFDANKSDGDNRIEGHADAMAIWGMGAQGLL